MNKITEELLRAVSDFKGSFEGAFNIREDGGCAGRQSTQNIQITSKKDLPGIDIHIAPGTKGETVYIPACVTHSDVNDLVYNDFYVGEGADVVIVAGCGVHSDGEEEARHNGIHRFFVKKGAHVVYREKHLGTGKGNGARRIDPITDVYLEEDSSLEMDTVQLGGVDRTTRKTSGVVGPRACVPATPMPIPAVMPAAPVQAAPAAEAPAQESAVPASGSFSNLTEVKSPMVGVFYDSPSPEADPYVKVGDKVKKGDVLCIIEAMKLLNEITAEQDGEIVDICAHNADVVEYGQTLFKIF